MALRAISMRNNNRLLRSLLIITATLSIVPSVLAFGVCTPAITAANLIGTKKTRLFAGATTSTETMTQDKSGSSSSSIGGIQIRDVILNAARTRDSSVQDDDSALDISGIMWLEHINLVVTSKEIAEYFYLDFLGCTRDTGKSFHVNMGQQQFHLAEAKPGIPPQKINGSIGLTIPSLDTLRSRIPQAIEKCQAGTEFAILRDDVENNVITLSCPDGNIFHVYATQDDVTTSTKDTPRKMENLHAEGGSYGPQRMAIRSGNPGIRYIEFSVPIGSSTAISKFYKGMMNCNVQQQQVNEDDSISKNVAIVSVGNNVDLVFVERSNISQSDIDSMKGVHICIYVNDFKQLYDKLTSRSLIWTNPRFVHLDTCDTWEEAFNSRTLRFKHVIDIEGEAGDGDDKNNVILELEHETRPLRHGQYLKVPKYEPK